MQNLQQISEAAIAKAKEILAAAPTEDPVRKDITGATTGIAAYNLEPVGVLLQPVITPLVNMIPRVANTRGGTSAEWRLIQSIINGATFEPFPGSSNPSNRLSYNWAPKTAAFAPLGVGDRVEWDSIDASKTFEDVKARAVTNALFALKIIQEQVVLFGRIADLGSITTPTVTTSNSGGTIATPAGTYNLKVRAIVGMGNGTNTRGKISAAANWTLTGPNGSITAYTDPVAGASSYEWYVDDGNGGAYTLQTTTGNSSVKLIALTTSGTVAPANNVANANAYDGILPLLTANAPATNIKTLAKDVTAGLGTDFTLDDLDALNLAVWDNAKGDPDVIIAGSKACARLTNLWLAANGGPVSYVVPDASALSSLTGGYRLTRYVNKITGKPSVVITHPNMPDGMLMALTFQIPFPTGGDQSGIEVEYSRGYQQVDYARVARRDDFEVYSRECLKLKFVGGGWLLTNASSKTTA